MKIFACTRMARAWIINICVIIVSITVLAILTKEVAFSLIIGVVCFALSIFQAGLGAHAFRVFTVTKIDEEGLKNNFCHIKWTEIEATGIESINNESVVRRCGILQQDFGLVLLIHKKAEDKEKTFVTYLNKDTICIPYDERTKVALKKYSPLTVKRFNL